MSVYKPQGSRFFQYDFRYKGRRFHGPTGQTARRDAQEVERALRRKAALGTLDAAEDLTLEQAAGRWFKEVGKDRAKPLEIDRQLEQLLTLIDRSKKLSEISTSVVSEAIERRKGIAFRKSPKKDAKTYLPSNATVNRDVIDTLRPILNRAREVWEAKGLPEINWKKLRLKEPPGVTRTFGAAEQDRWMEECDPVARQALHMLLRYGLRFGELFFEPGALETDDAGSRLSLKKRKRDVPLLLPLRPDDARLIAARAGRAAAAGLETIWFEENEDGELEPLTYHGLHARLSSAAKRAGVRPGRVIHGTRHHAGTAVLRRSKNLKVAQQMLGHVSIQSTMRYAKALEEDLRDALDMDSRVCPEAETEPVRKPKRRKG